MVAERDILPDRVEAARHRFDELCQRFTKSPADPDLLPESLRDLSSSVEELCTIAEELRHQYTLSYYPTNSKKDGTYRRVKVRVGKPGMVVRSRDGYRAVEEMQGKSDLGGTDRPELKRRQ